MKKTLFIVFLAALGITGCKKAQKSDNPFFNTYDTPFEVPPFEQIKAAHFMPAYLKGMEEDSREIKAIITNTEAPTFENTIKALTYSGDLLTKVRYLEHSTQRTQMTPYKKLTGSYLHFCPNIVTI